MANRVPLTCLARELTALTGQPAPNYRRLRNLVASGEIPAVQTNGRYTVDPREAAKALGMTIAKQAA
jgi:hypothetical protein